MRVIEVIIASFIVISALSFLSMFAITPHTSQLEVNDLEKTGYSLLLDLDNQGILAPMIYGNQESDLHTALKITLPVDVYFRLTVYDTNWSKIESINDVVYGDETTFSSSESIASVSYILNGYKNGTPGDFTSEYEPRILVLQLTRG